MRSNNGGDGRNEATKGADRRQVSKGGKRFLRCLDPVPVLAT